ncbi:MAG: GAF domain-containing protein [Dehalococcoidia bacterium]
MTSVQPSLDVRIEDIPTCFDGAIPSAICTVAEDGTPNVTYLSIVHRVDDTHVALSRQFFKKTDHNIEVNPRAQVSVTEPETGRIFLLDVVYVRTETEGPTFERMRTRLDAVAAHEGMANVFRLKGTDVCRVEACQLLPGFEPNSLPRRDIAIERVEAVSRRLTDVGEMEELFGAMLDACAELLGYPHAAVMLADETGEHLYTVASTGFEASGAGSEVRIGEGLIGVAAGRRQSVRVADLGREISYSHAILDVNAPDDTAVEDGPPAPSPTSEAIALPWLPRVRSLLVTPMLAYHKLVGVLYLQSEEPGAFLSNDECVVGILANQAAMALATLRQAQAAPEDAGDAAREAPEAVVVRHYPEDDSVFLDGEYLIKGVAGSILWRLLQQYQEQGRSDFTNRELRLDQSIGLPDIKDNLEARLILLRKRLEERCTYLRIERSGRGRFHLHVDRPLVLEQAP